MDTERTIIDMPLDGGDLALDFVNTTGGPRDAPPAPSDELLETYDDLVAWARRVGALSERDARSLLRSVDEAAGRKVLRRALELRDLIYAIFRSVADERPPDEALLSRLRDAERDALTNGRLAPGKWTWPEPTDPAAPLWPVTHAAVELLTHGPLERVKVCGNCRWLFLDQSRNRSRRWCSMETCGTHHKQRRFVERRRQQRASRG